MAMEKDLLDRVILFLQKREGIDKTLKLIRYTSRLVAATSPPDSETHKRFAAFEKSVGVSRKAFRLGKFLQDINNLRKSRSTGVLVLLELVAYGGEGIYYFIEQLAWLIKAGALSKESEAELSFMSAWAELAGYVANITLSLIKLNAINREERLLLQAIQLKSGVAHKAQQDGSEAAQLAQGGSTAAEAAQGSSQSSMTSMPQPTAAEARKLASLRAARKLRLASIVQDVADSCLALNDVRGGRDKWLSHPVTLALAGLVSGCISAHKNWNS